MSNKVLDLLIKEAGMGSALLGAAKGIGAAVKADASKLPGQLKNVQLAAKANGVLTRGTASTVKAVAGNKAVQAGAGALAAAGAAGAAMSREKKAAFDSLTESGVSFDEAVELIKSASEKVYGKK